MKAMKTLVAATNSAEIGKKNYTVVGLPRSTALIFATLFAVGFWFYGVVWTGAPFTVADSQGYIRVAQDLADFHVDELNLRTPGYPFLLVLTGTGRPLFYTSLALHFACIWLLSAVLYTMGLTRGWLVLLALLLLLPPYVDYAAYILTENLSEFLVVSVFSSLVFWFLRGRRSVLLVLSGIVIACSGLTRPIYEPLALVVAGCLLMMRWVGGQKAISYRDCVKAGMVLLTTSVLLIGGFSLMNYVKFNFFGIYPIAGLHLSNRTIKILERLPDQYAAEREALIKARNAQLIEGDDHTGDAYFYRALPELRKITGAASIPELSQHLLHLNLILIKSAPLHYLQEVLVTISGYCLPSANYFVNMNSRGMQTLWVVLHFAVLGLFILQLIVITGLAIFQMSQRFFLGETNMSLSPGHVFAYFFAAILVFYTAASSALVTTPDPRYVVPIQSLIIFLCFLGFYLWRQLLLRTESQQISCPTR
jgi:hypothetical protein